MIISKFKTNKLKGAVNDVFKTGKILKIGKILLEKIGCEGKMVRFTDHLSATGYLEHNCVVVCDLQKRDNNSVK